MLTCGRCGRENPDSLRFCADCGTRLGPAPVASATPPRGLVAATSRPPGQSQPPRPRPIAPEFDFSPKPDPQVCASCGAANTPDGRFCTACGLPLRASTAAPPAAAPIGTGGSAAQPGPLVVCGRCHGANPTHVATCQYCGTRLLSDAGPPEPRAARTGEPPARLVVIAQDGTPGAEHQLAGTEILVGRSEGTVTLPADPYVSPRHMAISRRNGRFFVRDLESVNGVYLRLRGPEPLRHTDLVLIGLEVLRFELVSEQERRLGPATERGARVFGSPSLPRYARLCQHTVEGVTRDVYYLGRDELTVGRESGDLVFTGDPFMSRRHATITRDPATGVFTLRDLGSSNGTYLAIREEREIAHGDHLRIGQHLFRLEVGGVES